MSGCSSGEGETKVVLTTGFSHNEIFRIEDISATLPEVMVYLTNMQNQYERVYGNEIWSADLNGVTLEENVKETVLAQIAQVKTMNLLAHRNNIVLSESEIGIVEQISREYYLSLTDAEKDTLDVDEDLILKMYTEYALAEKVYADIIKDINPEISDDEARTITIQHIFFTTNGLDSRGERVEFPKNIKEEIYEKAKMVLELTQTMEFETLMDMYSEDENGGTYSFGKGDLDADFEKAAFDLDTGEISNIVETEMGYHIIKCISTFDREETDINKVKIVEQRRKEVFGQEYDEFVKTLAKSLNEKLWKQVRFVQADNIVTTSFFELYKENMHFDED